MRSGFALGLLVGFLLTLSLVALLYLVNVAAGAPFIPFDLFDGVARILPGSLVTFGIDSMVRVLMFLGLSLKASSKTAEQIQALSMFIAICAIAGGIFFATFKRGPFTGRFSPGIILGIATAIPVVVIQYVALAPQHHLAIRIIWTVFALIVWGLSVNGVQRRLTRLGEARIVSTPQQTVPAGIVKAVNRRSFLINLGGVTASITVVGAGVAAALRRSRHENFVRAGSVGELPNQIGSVIPAPGTRSEYTPVREHYRIDINLSPMRIDGDAWRLPIIGMVDRPLDLGLSDIKNFGEPLHQFVTLACISNPVGGDLIGTTRWSGISVRNVLRTAGVQERARFLKISSQDGFYEIVPIDLIDSDERIMFTYAWDGRPLPAEHGFPLRVYIPDRYGMKQPKWIIKAELIENDEPGYWVARGWDKIARMKATSVIDTVAIDAAIENNGQTLIPIGGIAHAGARGISRVEVRVDDGAWTPAQLRTPLSDLTWVIWRYDWSLQAGNHVFSVRCYDGSGIAQIETSQDPHPSGATGIFSMRKKV